MVFFSLRIFRCCFFCFHFFTFVFFFFFFFFQAEDGIRDLYVTGVQTLLSDLCATRPGCPCTWPRTRSCRWRWVPGAVSRSSRRCSRCWSRSSGGSEMTPRNTPPRALVVARSEERRAGTAWPSRGASAEHEVQW